MLVSDWRTLKSRAELVVVRAFAVVATAAVLGGLCFQQVHASDASSLIEEVYVLDAEGEHCLSCPDGVVPTEVTQVIGAADAETIGGWIQRRFSFRTEQFNSSFKSGDPIKHGLGMRMGEMGGVSFHGDGYTIHYESIPCWVWDCYKPRMWREDRPDSWVWRRKVPFAHAPIYPFVVGDYVLFVGQSSGTYDLVILDVNTGRVVEQFTPDGEPDGFVGSALLFAPGFYRDGYIYLKTWTKTTWDPATRETIREEPAKIYVLKVRF